MRYPPSTTFDNISINRGVFFSYPGRLRDPFEGMVPPLTRKRLYEWLIQKHKAPVHQFDEIVNIFIHNLKNQHIVSCWHAMEHESEAMWRLYAGTGAGIAIKTTFESLEKAFKSCAESNVKYKAGKVIYVDYDTCDIPLLNAMALFHKKESFSLEREVRIVRFSDGNEDCPGITCSADLGELIQEVVVSPLADSWMFKVVKETTAKFDASLVKRIRKSK